jgi:hypothetical protein
VHELLVAVLQEVVRVVPRRPVVAEVLERLHVLVDGVHGARQVARGRGALEVVEAGAQDELLHGHDDAAVEQHDGGEAEQDPRAQRHGLSPTTGREGPFIG